jgi:hypothetical protein
MLTFLFIMKRYQLRIGAKMKERFDKNGIKVLPPQKRHRLKPIRECWKVIYLSQETAEKKAAAAHDLRGDYVAYLCPRYNHWHIGHKMAEVTSEQKQES